MHRPAGGRGLTWKKTVSASGRVFFARLGALEGTKRRKVQKKVKKFFDRDRTRTRHPVWTGKSKKSEQLYPLSHAGSFSCAELIWNYIRTVRHTEAGRRTGERGRGFLGAVSPLPRAPGAGEK